MEKRILNNDWMDPNKLEPIKGHELLYFFACYYYMGYTKLPSKTDYWVRPGTFKCIPSHWMKDGKFSSDRFIFI